MKRIMLTVAYDGTNYHGWQLQDNAETIEGVLNRELSAMLKENIEVTGASRTDAGVHALGNIAVFDTESRIPAEKISYALNTHLPADIRIQKSEEMPEDFHPRKVNGRKTYEYRILNREFELPSERLNSFFYHGNLNVEEMQRAAKVLIGEHDFQSFCSVHTQAEDTIRTIYDLQVVRDEDLIRIRVTGNGFLYNMVRIIAGTLLQVGSGKLTPEEVHEILQSRDRTKAGMTAPAHGLTLISLVYEKELSPVSTVENEDWSYEIRQDTIMTEKKAYVTIRRCREDDRKRLEERLRIRCERNGADEVIFL